MIHVGVTGTRGVLSERQKSWLKDEMAMLDLQIRLVRLQRPVLHHGDCVGADSWGHELADVMGWEIVIHPPVNSKYRAHNQIPEGRGSASKICEERGYLARDRSIVQRCSIILGIPQVAYKGEFDRSGTWYTILRAMEKGREIKICNTE